MPRRFTYRTRRMIALLLLIIVSIWTIATNKDAYQPVPPRIPVDTPMSTEKNALRALDMLAVKGRAAKTGYQRSQFGDGWTKIGQCDMRNIILKRDMRNVIVNSECKVMRGILQDPYTGKQILFVRGDTTSDDVQIDHVVALSDAWQKGAQLLSVEQRIALANDPLELLAVDGNANQAKAAGDAATWLPENKLFRCEYVARQIAVKQKYALWVTASEKDALRRVLDACPGQTLP